MASALTSRLGSIAPTLSSLPFIASAAFGAAQPAQKTVRFASTVSARDAGEGSVLQRTRTEVLGGERQTAMRRRLTAKVGSTGSIASALVGKKTARGDREGQANGSFSLQSPNGAIPSLRTSLLLGTTFSARQQRVATTVWSASRLVLIPLTTTTQLRSSSPLSTSSEPSSAATASAQNVTWSDYFRLRTQRASTERISGIIAGAVSFLAATYYVVVVMPFDPTEQWFGMLSPDIVGALGIILAAVIGRWVGVLLGGELWAMRNKGLLDQFTARDKSFAQHVTTQRAPQQALNVSAQHPDYYAEQVNSIRTYHKWLRSQRNYERGKETKNVGMAAMLRQVRVPGLSKK